MAQLWHNYGTTMAQLWHNYGTTMAPPWRPHHHGTTMAPPWRPHHHGYRVGSILTELIIPMALSSNTQPRRLLATCKHAMLTMHAVQQNHADARALLLPRLPHTHTQCLQHVQGVKVIKIGPSIRKYNC